MVYLRPQKLQCHQHFDTGGRGSGKPSGLSKIPPEQYPNISLVTTVRPSPEPGKSGLADSDGLTMVKSSH